MADLKRKRPYALIGGKPVVVPIHKGRGIMLTDCGTQVLDVRPADLDDYDLIQGHWEAIIARRGG